MYSNDTMDAYCPHCFLLVESEVRASWPPVHSRCPHCRLLIGAGRARPTSEATPGPRGTAAGGFAQQGRDAGLDRSLASPDEVREAIRVVANQLGSRPE